EEREKPSGPGFGLASPTRCTCASTSQSRQLKQTATSLWHFRRTKPSTSSAPRSQHQQVPPDRPSGPLSTSVRVCYRMYRPWRYIDSRTEPVGERAQRPMLRHSHPVRRPSHRGGDLFGAETAEHPQQDDLCLIRRQCRPYELCCLL